MCMETNLIAGWAALLGGVLFGAVLGLFFHGEGWLGGYASWRRRLLRLAHVSFFGVGMINILFALAARSLPVEPAGLASTALLAGGALMPPLCMAAAFRPELRHLLALPVVMLISGLTLVVWMVAAS